MRPTIMRGVLIANSSDDQNKFYFPYEVSAEYWATEIWHNQRNFEGVGNDCVGNAWDNNSNVREGPTSFFQPGLLTFGKHSPSCHLIQMGPRLIWIIVSTDLYVPADLWHYTSELFMSSWQADVLDIYKIAVVSELRRREQPITIIDITWKVLWSLLAFKIICAIKVSEDVYWQRLEWFGHSVHRVIVRASEEKCKTAKNWNSSDKTR